MESIDTLVCARWIAPVEPDVLLERHALAIRAGRVVALLPEAEARTRFAPREHVERPDHLITPGLVNASVHGAATLLRGLGDGQPRDVRDARLRALQLAWATTEAVRDGTSLAIAELLAAGVTCFGDTGPFPDTVAATAVDAGLRVAVGLPIDERPSAWASDADEHFERGLRVHDDYRDHPLVSAAFTAADVGSLTDATLQRLKVLVDQLQAPLVVPLHESAAAVAACRREHGATPLARLERLGLLNGSLVGVHFAHVGQDEIVAAGRARIRAVHCPTADLALGAGVAPVPALLEAGVDVCLGSGPAVVTGDLDLVREMRLASLLATGTSGDTTALPPSLALRLATLHGAAALGIDDQTGSLAIGKWADFACFDLAQLPTLAIDDPLVALVRAGGRDLVTDVWVAGREVYANGSPTRLDAADVAARAADWRRRRLAGVPAAARQWPLSTPSGAA
jgi:5-methylthioadenosine/S-adenosylhomocysteine deaminase